MTDILPFSPPKTKRAADMLAGAKALPMLINGEWVSAQTGETIPVQDPASGKEIAQIGRGAAYEVDAAVAAARKALPEWGKLTPRKRALVLHRLGDLIDENVEELSELETLDQGKPYSVSRWAEIPSAAKQFRFFAGLCQAIEGKTISPSVEYQPEGRDVHAWTLREPMGVIGAIVPWNSPLVLTAMKVAPALAAGCTVVLKPAEATSLTALRLGELALEAGLPPGALNVVTGYGHEAGSALASHMDVDKIAFTGSTATGRAIVDASKSNLKRVSLELGGKSPAVVLKDADLDLVIPGLANGIFFNAGQVCVANSRAYIHKDIYDKVIEGIAEYGSKMQMGHGLNPDTVMGPVVSRVQADKIQSYIDDACKAGGSALGGGQFGDNGTFIKPAVVTDVGQSSPINRDEVFGPVIVATPFEETADAIDMANDTDFGLAASVWTTDFSSAHRISRVLQAGTVWLNAHSMFDASLPIGGVRQSGYGRDSGVTALDNYLEWKTICAVV